MKTAKSDTQNETKCLETHDVFKMSREVLSLALKFTFPIHPESSVTIKNLIKPNVPLFQSFFIFQIIKKQITWFDYLWVGCFYQIIYSLDY